MKQLTLGQLITILSNLPQGALTNCNGGFFSYRGRYDECAMEPSSYENPPRYATVGELLKEAKEAMTSRAFWGWKNSEEPYYFDTETPMWIGNDYEYPGLALTEFKEIDGVYKAVGVLEEDLK